MLVYINQMDNRCKYLAKLMTRDGYEVVDNQDKLPSCMIVYLGVDGKDCKQDDFAFGSVVFTLLKNQRLEYLSKINGFKYHYLYTDKTFVLENSYISDEALIAYMIIDNAISLNDSNILILGYGNCGKDLASKLVRFNAHISVSTREEHYRNEIILSGYRYLCLEKLSLHGFDFIINTVPDNIIDEKMMDTKDKDCQIYDIASKPYGLSSELRDVNYHLLKQLPTKYAYQSSALALYKAIKRAVDSHVEK